MLGLQVEENIATSNPEALLRQALRTCRQQFQLRETFLQDDTRLQCPSGSRELLPVPSSFISVHLMFSPKVFATRHERFECLSTCAQSWKYA